MAAGALCNEADSTPLPARVHGDHGCGRHVPTFSLKLLNEHVDFKVNESRTSFTALVAAHGTVPFRTIRRSRSQPALPKRNQIARHGHKQLCRIQFFA